MADKKPKLPTLVTPAGSLQFPWLGKADTKFAKEGEKGDYKTDWMGDTAAASGIIGKIEEAANTKFAEAEELFAKAIAELKAKGEHAKAKKKVAEASPSLFLPFELQLDADEEPTGKVKIKFKVNAEGKNAAGDVWDNKPPVFDAAKQPVSKPVYAGTTAKVAFQIVPFYNAATGDAGVTLRLKAVQVINLVTKGSGANADAFGFDEEDGYVGEEAANAFDDESATDTGTDSGDVDF